ncbi:DUF6404 family protein [Chitiniphilus eburneus]|uniref:Uncharacterized protein n=1 Tax=Chitiniphilus eburneus TaxID=2571148 RepID=A0A4U0PWR4_9NEIS|nr:DUF6404 family protein [Chitiniphilus eburneus]TJZ73013.1 hypothetical protein FAZ21_12405 [Chitiniphilus eburneus]
MSFETRLAAAITLLNTRGVGESARFPWWLRLAWRLGLRLRPPHFQPFAVNLFWNGLWFGAIWGVCMWLALWGPQVMMPCWLALLLSALVGTIYGLFQALFYAATARQYRLPRWEDLPE